MGDPWVRLLGQADNLLRIMVLRTAAQEQVGVLTSLAAVSVMLAGCEQPNRVAKYPEGALHVRYERATTYSTCLVASVAMAGNYLLDEHRYSESVIRDDLKRTGRDETLVSDLKNYLAEEGLHLFTLSGRWGDEPPTGIGYWLNRRGYPVICVINRVSDDPAYNHAVVVIGISANRDGGSTDIIHYLDPSAAEPLQTTVVAGFEPLWARSRHAMMVVAAAPADRREAPSEEGP